MSRGKLRVLSIAHSAITRSIGRLRYERLINDFPDIDLTLLTPDRWIEYGKSIPLDPPTGGLDVISKPVRLQSLPYANWYLHYYPGLGKLVTALRPDVIHLWEEPWSLVALQAARLRKRLLPTSALVLETDQNIYRRLPVPFQQIRRTTLRQADLLIGRQDESLEVCRVAGYSGPTSIVEYGTDQTIFNPGTALKSPGDGFVLGYVGRIIPEKGLQDVLSAMAHPNCRLPAGGLVSLLVHGDGPYRDALKGQASELGIANQLQFLPSCAPDRVAEFMRGLDALVLMSRTMPSWKEQFGRVIMESQACGTPVIGSTSGSIPSVVGPGGWIVPEADIGALASVIARLAAHPLEVAAARTAGLTQAGNRYSFATVTRKLGDAFYTAIQHRRAMLARTSEHPIGVAEGRATQA